MDFSLRPVGFADLPGWRDDDPSALFAAMRRCLAHIRDVKPYKTGQAGISPEALADIFAEAGPDDPADAAAARAFFETRFTPVKVARNDGKPGFVTAFYEPEVAVSDQLDATFRYPFYRRPADLIDLDDTNRPPFLDASYAFAKLLPDGAIVAHDDRQAVDEGSLAGKGLEIAWAASRVDVFFAHVQGAARLRYRDGSVRRITFAAKAGHPFSAIGKRLVDLGEIPLADISMQSIRAWLAAHPERQDEILWHNRSYIYFREAAVDDLHLGPIAAAKVPLVAGRSLAVDKLVHTFATPFFIASDSLTRLDGGKPFRRLMMALDTGTAIVGPARGDIFTGSGDEAGEMAGAVRNDADFFMLVPNGVLKDVVR